jgi:hypothetical protein
MSYGPEGPEYYKRLPVYILKRAKPADIRHKIRKAVTSRPRPSPRLQFRNPSAAAAACAASRIIGLRRDIKRCEWIPVRIYCVLSAFVLAALADDGHKPGG